MSPKFTDTFKSTNGLEEFERDDLDAIINSLAQTAKQIKAKEAKGRNTRSEEKAVEKGVQEGLKIMIEWTKRPQPSSVNHLLQLDEATRLIMRKVMVLSDTRDPTTLASEAFCGELLQEVLEIAASIGIEIGAPDLDDLGAEKMNTTGSSDPQYDPFGRTAYKPMEYSVQDLVNWDEEAQKMEDEMDVDGESMGRDSAEDDDIDELEWPNAIQDA